MEKDDKKKTGFPNLLGRGKNDNKPQERAGKRLPPPKTTIQEKKPVPKLDEKEKAEVKEEKKEEAPRAAAPPKEERVEEKPKESGSPNPTMMKDDEITNNISADLSEQDKKEIYDAIDLIRRKLSFAKDFSQEEKSSLMHLGQTGRNFVERAQNLVQRAPGILPRSFDVEEFHRDAELYQELGNITEELKKLTERISDTEAAVGSDAFTASLVVYQSGKLARTGDDMDNHLAGWRRKISDQVSD